MPHSITELLVWGNPFYGQNVYLGDVFKPVPQFLFLSLSLNTHTHTNMHTQYPPNVLERQCQLLYLYLVSHLRYIDIQLIYFIYVCKIKNKEKKLLKWEILKHAANIRPAIDITSYLWKKKTSHSQL